MGGGPGIRTWVHADQAAGEFRVRCAELFDAEARLDSVAAEEALRSPRLDLICRMQYIGAATPAPQHRASAGRRAVNSLTDHAEVIGILGGMGPAATADFYTKLVSATPGRRDQDHLKTVIWSDPTIPDRTEALLGNGPDPTPWLLHGSRLLREAGATVIAIPCNTAHAFVPRIAGHVGLPIVDMIAEVASHVAALDPPIRTAGLLATTGTIRAGLYQERLAQVAIDLVLSDRASQDSEVMAAVRAVKAGRRGSAADLLARAANRLIDQGAQVIIAGCTEIPLGLAPESLPVPLVDPALVLARALIDRTHPAALGHLR
jgi:aspartate racemase